MRLFPLLLAGLVLIGAAFWLRSSPWLREPILRAKDLPQLEAAVKRNPDDALAQYYLAKRYYLDHRYAEAQDAYETAAVLDPHAARVHLGLALSLFEQGKLEQAQTEFERTLQWDPRSAWAEYMLGKILWLQGDAVGAAPHVRRATQLDPRSDEAWYGLGVCDVQLTNYSEATAAFRQAVERQDTSPKYHTALGQMLVYHGSTSEGRQQYERALQLDPDFGPACALLGSFYLHKATDPDAVTRAEELLKRATRLKTLHPEDVWLDLGQVYIKKAQYKQAVAALEESLRKDARDERAYYALANAYRRMGDAPKAEATEARFRHISALHVRMQEMEARVSHNPDSAAAHRDLARVYGGLGLDDKAMQQYAAAVRLEPNSAETANEWKKFIQTHAPADTQSRDFVLPSPR